MKGVSKYGIKHCKACKVLMPMQVNNYNRRTFCSNACARGYQVSQVGILERFWSGVQKTEGCWNFMRRRKPDGYCFFSYGKTPQTQIYAHRFSYELHHGPIPAGHDVCHHCDNTRCVRPDHLFAGTEKENMHDMIRKGRNPLHSLKADQVREVRALLAEGKLTQREIGAMFGVNHGIINRINVGRTYQYVTELLPQRDRHGR